MVKKTLLGLAIAAAAAGLSGCKTGSDPSVDTSALTAGTTNPDTVTPVFNVARKNLPLATDFLFSGSEDGTLVYAAGDVDIFLADGTRNPDYNPVYDAISDLDGFSTVAPLYVNFSGELAAGTAPAGSVYLIPMNYIEGDKGDGPKLGVLDTSAPLDTAKIAAVKAEVISYADGSTTDNVLRISPTTPLQNDTRYLVVLTDRLLDADGDATQMPNQYEYLIGDDDLLNTALAPARTAMKGWYQLASGFLAQADASAKVTTAYTFTTGGTAEVLSVMAAPGNADSSLTNTIPAFLQNYMARTSDDASTQVATINAVVGNLTTAQTIYGGYQLLKTLPMPTPRVNTFPGDAAAVSTALITGSTATSTFVTGSIELPYYSIAPAGAYSDDGITPVLAPNTAYTCVDTTDATCLASKASAAGTVTGQWESDENVVVNLKVATGSTEEAAAAFKAPSENVTNLFPFAKEQGKVAVPVMVVQPDENDCPKPWKTVIYQHGITSNRIATIPLAEQMAAAPGCFATVAIDLPMHGLLPTDLVKPAPYTGLPVLAAVNQSSGGTAISSFLASSTSDKSTSISIETLKQRHFGLTAAADGATPTAVTGVATDQSGSLYISFLHFQATRDNNRQAVMDLLNLNATIPFMDIDNDGNGGLTNASPDFDASKIYFAGISLGSIVGMQFVAVNNANASKNSALNTIKGAAFGVPGGGLPKLLEHSDTFGPRIAAALSNPDTFNLTVGGESFESLQYVYQATVDSADPINFAAILKATGTPFTLIESIGDAVIPNSVESAPLAGTDPLIAVTGATQIDSDSTFTAAQQVYVKLADEFSNHGSMAVPDTDATTPETAGTFATLATHVISFFSGAGVLDDSLYGGNIVEPVSE